MMLYRTAPGFYTKAYPIEHNLSMLYVFGAEIVENIPGPSPSLHRNNEDDTAVIEFTDELFSIPNMYSEFFIQFVDYGL